ncbi:MAG: hypothetical protein EHM93_07250 [Bacteroidales bacterium]|nr:MAG: hypothetical protein EHM93_07250 [Bacteroidales bacterium]
MKKINTIILGVIFLSFFNSAASSQNPTSPKLVYEWYAPANLSNYPAILIIGGSDGGLKYGQGWASLLNTKGFGVMALAYFGINGLKTQLEEIPIEYFQNALDTLKTFQGVDKNKIAIICNSKGTEASLLLAAQDKSICLVLASSPSYVVWQCINKENYSSFKSSWTKGGVPIPFVPFDYSKGYYPIINFYLGSLEKSINEDAIIKVENSKAKIVLFSGGKDQIWPSSEMAARLKKRVEGQKSGPEIKHYDFPEAGHGFLIPFQSDEEKKIILTRISNFISFFGGTIEAYDNAMCSSLQITLSELEKVK